MYDVTPVVSLKATDCGPACLKMLLAYYGTEADLDVLSKDCNINVSGCTAGDVMRAAKKHGMKDIKAYKMDAEEVYNQDRPSIIWWKYYHFCVCCGLNDEGKVVICNPNRGRYAVSKSLFKSFYSGVSLFNGEPEWLPGTKPETEEE